MGVIKEEKVIEKERRLKICEGCSLKNGNICDSSRYEELNGVRIYGCGCYLDKKALVSKGGCPLGKW